MILLSSGYPLKPNPPPPPPPTPPKKTHKNWSVLKFQTLVSLGSQIICWFFMAGIHKILVWIPNREDTDQSDLGLHLFVLAFGRQLQ